jgi:hypothetical protein
VLVDFLDGDIGQPPRRPLVVFHGGAVLQARWDAAIRKDPGKAAHGIGAAAEPKKKDTVPRPPEPDQHFVTVDDIGGQPEAGRLAQEVVSHANHRFD